MARTRILAALATASIIALPALAQAASTSGASSTRTEFVRPGDVSPAEFSRVLEEADRVRAYQAAQANTPAPVYTANPNSAQGMQPQTYADYIAARRAAQSQAQVQVQPKSTYQSPRPTYQQPTYQPRPDYVPRPNYPAQPVNTYPAGQPLYQQPVAQPVYQAPQPKQQYVQAPLPRNTVYQAPANNRVIYAAMPDVMGAGPIAHQVVKGDTLYSLSKRYGVTLANLKQANGLTGNIISIGQRLTLPGRTGSMPVSYAIPNPNAAPAQYTSPAPAPYRTVPQTNHVRTTYTAVPGSNLVKAVQPVPPSGVYAVLPNDTLYGISRFACVNPYDVARLNGITDTTALTPGQKLSMPSGHCLN